LSLTTFLFDLDGTLIDSIDLILRSYRHTLQVHRGVVPPDELWLEGLGTPTWVQFRSFSDDPAEIEAMVATYRTYNRAHHDRLVRGYPGVPEAVRAIKAAGAALGVVTSKVREGAHRGLVAGGYDGLFDVIIGADDVTRTKPDPEPVRRALADLGATPESAVFVGDATHDLVAGRAAGVKTAAALWGPFARELLAPHAPDFWLGSPGELQKLMVP
jgi:pyrophosphatase PpaX